MAPVCKDTRCGGERERAGWGAERRGKTEFRSSCKAQVARTRQHALGRYLRRKEKLVNTRVMLKKAFHVHVHDFYLILKSGEPTKSFSEGMS